MQIKEVKVYVTQAAVCLFLLLFFQDTACCQEQADCEENLNLITKAYNDGDWSTAKNASINFIRNIREKDAIYFSSVHVKYSEYCKTNIPQVYTYLIRSYLRLYELDSAKKYYIEALINEYKIKIDATDQQIFNGWGTLKKHSAALYLGILSSDIRETQLGLTYGLTPRIFLETTVNNMHFNHGSDVADGIMGKPLIKVPNQFPNYTFRIQGYERYLNFASYIKTPIFVSRNDVNIFYISIGGFITYYLNSYVNTYDLTRYDSNRLTPVYVPFDKNKRYVSMDALGLTMDLKRLYKDRFNYGLFMNLGSSIRLKNLWEIFFEIKFAAGRNNSYRDMRFTTYKPGVQYFFLVVGTSKTFYKFRAKKQ